MKTYVKIFLGIALVAWCVPHAAYAAPGNQEASFRYNSHGKRDPFMPLVDKDGEYIKSLYSSGTLQDLTLEGVVYDDEGDSYAIISGKVLREKDMIGEYKVYKITKDKVFLVKGETFHELTLPRVSRPKEENKK
jgi:hypothetical protein